MFDGEAVAARAAAARDGALRVADGASRAREWVKLAGAEAMSVANEAASLRMETLRVERLARQIARAATRRMCVGVYGASQQGKSYLVSVLGRPPGKSELMARFGAISHDFIRDINPQGGKESTGLATRFSTAVVAGEFDVAHPVELALLNELDLVKILANSFQSDFDQNNLRVAIPLGEEVCQALLEAERIAGSQIVATHLDVLGLSELSDYMRRNFKVRWDLLEPLGYWQRLINVIPRLPLERRAQLFATLWGGLDEFTSIFHVLAQALERLGGAETAVTSMQALVPRETSIIDVAVLKRLVEGDDGQDQLAVRPRRGDRLGAAVVLPRAVVAALVAELRITMEERPWPMFEHTDLLDFPGARSRLKLVELASPRAERIEQVAELLLRGKVAYLFQRYAEERELTAMLLCMGNKPNEVKDLGALVRQWVEMTHGATAEVRGQVPCSLFLILTMMDLEFLPKAGETAASLASKWDIRLHTSLLEPFQNDGWVKEFANGAFDATMMLRNPNFRQDHLIEYELRPDGQPREPLVEAGIRPLNRAYVDQLRQAFVGSAEVARHVADPPRVWEAMFAFNDGGVSYIVERLDRVSDPALRIMQAEARLREGVLPLNKGLKRFHHGVDEAARREKEAALRAARTGLQKAFQRSHYRAFPRFLAALMLREGALRDVALGVASMDVEKSLAAEGVGGATHDEDLEDIFGATTEAPRSAPAARRDRPALFAREAVRFWIGVLRRLPQETTLLAYFELPARVVTDVADQLVIAANRLDLPDRIAAAVREATDLASLRWENVVDRIVIIAAGEMNAFVAELGWGGRPLEERPGVPEGKVPADRRVFEAQPILRAGEMPVLGAEPENLPRRCFVDWGVAFVRLGLDNLDHEGGRELSAARNEALGNILRQLAPA